MTDPSRVPYPWREQEEYMQPLMRECVVDCGSFEYIRGAYPVWKPELKKGFFHVWGTDFVEGSGDFISTVSFAIVELEDGQIVKVEPHHVKFTDGRAVAKKLTED
jgi:hypothetical protein